MVGNIKEIKIFQEFKICTLCNIEKHRSEFDFKGKTQKYLKSRCRECINKLGRNSDEKRQYMREYGAKNKKSLASSRLVRIFGITLEEKIQMLIMQDSKCKICGKILDIENYSKEVHLDHNHETNKIRGLLCSHCNVGLGAFKDNPEFLYNTINYLLDKDFNIEQLIKLETHDS